MIEENIMRLFFYVSALSVLVFFCFTGCSKHPPKCSEDSTTGLVKKLLLDNLHFSDEFSTEQIKNKITFEYIKPTSFDEGIKKYSCRADLIIGEDDRMVIDYESQLLDDGRQQLVSISNTSALDLSDIKEKIIRSIFSCPKSNEFCLIHKGINWSNRPRSPMSYEDGEIYCKSIGGRLPTISELRTLVQSCPATETGGECGVTDSCLSLRNCRNNACNGCSGGRDGSFSRLKDTGWFWSSSVVSGDPNGSWLLNFSSGSIPFYSKNSLNNVRCVK